MILELSGKFPVNMLCEEMGINRSSFYYWKEHLSNPAPRTKGLVSAIALFQEYHLKFPSHRRDGAGNFLARDLRWAVGVVALP